MSNMKSVLYIDDDPSNLDAVSRVLARQGYRVLTAHTGQQGIEMAERERPDVILLDILLPDMNGFDVCEHINSMPRLKKIPIIGITASSMDGDRQRSLAAGFDAYLAKPLARIELINAIEHATFTY
ncbi:MAG: response regulator [Phototrophicaceae bacterium]